MNPTTKLAMLRVTPKTVFSTSSMCNNAWLLLDLIQSPRRSCANHMGACVKGLLTQHAAIAMGILTRALTPARAARSIWKGIGNIAQNRPTESPIYEHMSRTIFCYLEFILSFAVPAYKPNHAAPAPTTILIKPDCSNVGAGSSINHIVHL